tara:strand:- start:514 stop:732 length:219 start_codon:yes stop_codon:yes gene_type:complete
MKIEKNIPISPFRIKLGKYSTLAHKMEEGDSVLCENQQIQQSLRSAISKCKGYKPLGRQQQDGTYRIWKVKK